jgi:hypothetical protein
MQLASRRLVMGVTLASALPPSMAPGAAEAKKRRKHQGKKRKKDQSCTTDCAGKACGDACCGECQECYPTRDICVVEPGSEGASCSGGECCGGACCPPTCQCGVPGPIQAIDDAIAAYFKLPTPFCNAIGTGQECGPGAPCPAGLECVSFTLVGTINVCVGLCPDVSYPAF